MVLSLSSYNVIQHLQEAGLCSSEDGASADAELPESWSKNLNFVVTLGGDRTLLVKQAGEFTDGIPQDFFNEWLFHQLLQQFPVLGNISQISSLVLHFSPEKSILVRNYLTDYVELASFYHQHQIFPLEIATAIGGSLGILHRATYNRREYRDFMATAPQGEYRYYFYNPAQGVESLIPEDFGQIPREAWEFYRSYQRDESLEGAIAELAYTWNPCCLTHNDLNFHNILLHSRWESLDDCLVRLIDWEAVNWGDPIYDLAGLVASYLRVWLDSLIVDPTLDLSESLDLAIVPLERLQPSILALVQAYIESFPVILNHRQDLLTDLIKFVGLVLIQRQKTEIKQKKIFNNRGLATLQFAQNCLTFPQNLVETIFGISASEIIQPFLKFNQSLSVERESNLVPLYYEKTRLRGC
ncbi:aminoglycoside phosphotransferase family protein [Calothrix sp. 336/3]|uniref:aminoglycoside phosphotransferase family protein n=1 Tax=Calothrix sp. 336/3 TaxID=1337936 RepID=UPI0004E38F88|nr:aminoglycoside phosphotransferase family protein [Calothrix sp. 336/3]AKG22309.1 aminoglycoside phosphotransferase [Calothrix sp. 336/3]